MAQQQELLHCEIDNIELFADAWQAKNLRDPWCEIIAAYKSFDRKAALGIEHKSKRIFRISFVL